MKNFLALVVAFILMPMSITQAQSSLDVKDLGKGWVGLTQQVDPFDKTKVNVRQIIKEKFTFRCREINLEVRSGSFNGLNFSADLKYIIDEQEPVDKKGRYSTYLGGSDIVTRSRYFSSKLSNEEIDDFKSGKILKLAGRRGTAWITSELKLDGFTEAYDAMCKK